MLKIIALPFWIWSRYYCTGRKSSAVTTHYDILELKSNCTTEDVRNSFLKLTKKYHPDICEEPTNTDKFVKIMAAYEVLIKSKSRAEYDIDLHAKGLVNSRRRGRSNFKAKVHENVTRHSYDEMYASTFKSSYKNKRKPINTENKSSSEENNLNQNQNWKTDYWSKLTGSGETPTLAKMATVPPSNLNNQVFYEQQVEKMEVIPSSLIIYNETWRTNPVPAYYGVEGVKKVSNTRILLLIAIFVIACSAIEYHLVKSSFQQNRAKLDEQSIVANDKLTQIRAQAEKNGNEVQLEKLAKKLLFGGIGEQ